MASFPEYLAKTLYSELGEDIHQWKVVFPNKRAGLFFSKSFESLIDRPMFAPEIISIEDYIKSKSRLVVPDQFSLLFYIHEVYQSISSFKEDFESFYSWGELLINDFNDVDQYMVDPKPLFANLREWKNLSGTDFLSEEQTALIDRFWTNFEKRPEESRQKFQKSWDILYEVYTRFTEKLLEDGKATNGLLYRKYAENLQSNQMAVEDNLIFAGFNALTKAEEVLISEALKAGKAKVFWDLDAYYAAANAKHREAGNFFREYKEHSVLGQTFPEELPDQIRNNQPDIKVIEVKGNIAQAKYVGQLLKNVPIDTLEKTAVILGDESMLLPLLYALPDSIQHVNVTMGYPIKFSSIYQLLSHCLILHKNKRNQAFLSRDLLKILKHPLIQETASDQALKLIKELKENNAPRVQIETLKEFESVDLLNTIFLQDINNYFTYLKQLLLFLHREELNSVETEFSNEVFKHLKKLEEIVSSYDIQFNIQTFLRLFNKIMNSLRIPFSGEPLKGLQIMGVLESRNLDFERIFFLNMNEDNFPGSNTGRSFIPYAIRKAYGLPTFEQRDAIYAYLFYRLLHRSKELTLLYNSDNTGGKGGEPSRYLLQLKYELIKDLPNIQLLQLQQSADIAKSREITIYRTDEVLQLLSEYTEKGKRSLSASALKVYLSCRLKFYFKYLANLSEAEEITEELDASDFGNIVHNVLEELYKPLRGKLVEAEAIRRLKKQVPKEIENQFIKNYGGTEGKPYAFEGRNIIIRDSSKRMIEQMLEYDSSIAPFTLLETEGVYAHNYSIKNRFKVRLKAIIDRVDQIDDSIRIIDYKSGADELSFRTIKDLFNREEQQKTVRNGAFMQTLLYSMVYHYQGNHDGKALIPGLYNGKNIFNDNFDFHFTNKNVPVTNAINYFDELKDALDELLIEIFDSEQPFDQTPFEENCQYCEFKSICNR